MNAEFKARITSELANLQPRGRWARVESALGRFAPAIAMRRERQRVELARFRAQGAYPNSGRANSGPFEGNPYQKQREQKQLMWNALHEIDNSGLAASVLDKVELYTCGELRYQARTGDKHVNAAYEAVMRDKCGTCLDIAGESTLRKMAGLAVRGRIGKGGSVLDLVRPYEDDPNIYLRGIEYDRIGSPFDFRISPSYMGGFHLGVGGRKVAVDIYNRDRMGGMYTFEEQIPIFDDYGRRQVFHVFRATAFDPHKGDTAFKTAIDNIHYIDQIRKYELQAMQWAATQTAIYYTETGEMPERPFETVVRPDGIGSETRIVHARGSELSSMTVGEKVEMFDSQRPSPNVIAMFLNTVNEVCIAVGLPMTFVYGMNGNGPGIRFEGAQADRAMGAEFATLGEQFLVPVGEAILHNEIRQGNAPYHPLWKRGRWIGPAKLSIDAGYDSASAINENKEGITSRSTILLDRSIDEDEEADQIEAEASDWIQRAKRVAKQEGCTWQEVIAMLRQSSGASGGVASTLPSPVTVPKTDPNKGATSDGVDVDPDNTKARLKSIEGEVIQLRAKVATFAKDENGHEHKGTGPGGGQFLPEGGGDSGGGKGSGSKKDEPDNAPAKKQKATSYFGYAGIDQNQASIEKATREVGAKIAPGVDLDNASEFVGGPPDAKVHIRAEGVYTDSPSIKIEISHPQFKATRVIKKGENGPYIENQLFVVNEGVRGGGIGANVFSSQVENARKSGFTHIATHAARYNGKDESAYNGYYTWARFGYDQALSDPKEFEGSKAQFQAIKKKFPAAKTVQDIMATKEGRDWWKQNGVGMHSAKFNLAPTSRASKVLEAYNAVKQSK